MRKVSLRDFQLKPKDYLNDLPIAITRYNNTIALLTDPETIGGPEPYNDTPKENLKEEWSKMGFCEEHFERGVTYNLKRAEYENPNGDITYDKFVCDNCLDNLKGKAQKEGVLYVNKKRYENA